MKQLHTAGEELFVDVLGGERSMLREWWIGLYNDSVDQLSDDATHDDITTEPTYDGPLDIVWPDVVGTELTSPSGTGYLYVLDVQDALRYDIAAATGEVDSYYVAADFRSDVLGQATENRNLLWTGGLDGTYDLSDDPNDVFPLEGVRFAMD